MRLWRMWTEWRLAVSQGRAWHWVDEDARWRWLRKRIALIAVATGAVLVVQTMVVYNPRFLVGALFAGREQNFLAVKAYSERSRAQLLRNLCYTYLYFQSGSETDPYLIPGGEACEKSEPQPGRAPQQGPGSAK